METGDKPANTAEPNVVVPTIEAAKGPEIFSPGRALGLTDEDLGKMREYFRVLEHAGGTNPTNILSNITVLFPDQAIDKPMLDRVWQTTTDRIARHLTFADKRFSKMEEVWSVLQLLANLKEIDHERFNNSNLANDCWKQIKPEIPALLAWEHSRQVGSLVKIVYPAKFDKKKPADYWEKLKEDLQKYKDNHWTASFVRSAAGMRIMFPERFDELGINITDEEKAQLLREDRKDGRFSTMRALAIILADEVSVTEEGLKITYKNQEKPL